MTELNNKSVDPASQKMIKKAEDSSIDTIWDRLEKQGTQCKFGISGVCCRICDMGPCRLEEAGGKREYGVCGADVNTVVARNLARKIVAGCAAHSDHGRAVANTLLEASRGKAQGYKISDPVKLRNLAKEWDIPTDGANEEIAEKVALKALSMFGQQEGEILLTARAPKKQLENWRKINAVPRGIDREVVEVLHRTHIGVDNDYKNIINSGIRAALADGWGGSMIGTDISDILFGSPKPVRANMNLGVLREDQVNVVVHGHEPALSEMVVQVSREPEVIKAAEAAGAKGINLAGICCTANEVLMRHGIAVAGNFLQQELAIVTGAVDLMIVDVQCVMPGLKEVSNCFHTKVVTTSERAKTIGIQHVQFEEHRAQETAREIVMMAIENYKNRDPSVVNIPSDSSPAVAGFTTEQIFKILGGTYRSTYRPLNDAIIAGRIRGVAGVVGCNNPKIPHDSAHLAMVKELIKNDVLVVQTGCSAIACGKAGFLRPEAALEVCGEGLREVCEAVGIPPVLHVGSCVDNSRILTACCEMVKEGGIGTDISKLPVAGAAPEWMSEKAISIGFYVVASGIYTVFSTPQPVLGSQAVTDYITRGLEDVIGGRYDFEIDPITAAHMMIAHIDKKREALKLRPMMYGNKAEEVAAN
jgi:anaerobic carbon-monoxide dehydrogenase catalytic subunit